jgi:hypothetical protein
VDRLIKETTWSRVYEGEHGSMITRSKFRTDGLSVTFEHVKENWAQWNEMERLDFAQAYSAKTAFSADDDRRILEFVMKGGSEIVASTLAVALAGCSGSENAFDLIVSQLMQSANVLKGNFFQAIGKLGDKRGITVLEGFHEALAAGVAKNPTANALVLDYLSCCTALALLTRNSTYKQVVKGYLDDEREIVRQFATTLIQLKLADI